MPNEKKGVQRPTCVWFFVRKKLDHTGLDTIGGVDDFSSTSPQPPLEAVIPSVKPFNFDERADDAHCARIAYAHAYTRTHTRVHTQKHAHYTHSQPQKYNANRNQGCSRSEKKSAERIFTERIDKPHRSVTKLDNG